MKRSAGVLLHPTSLAGPAGSGDLGPAAHRFAQRLAAAGQTWWQMLPVGPADTWRSPYNGPSAFAGDPHLIAVEPLAEEGFGDHVRAGERLPTLRRVFAAFETMARGPLHEAFDDFRDKEKAWLDDCALFLALSRAHGGRRWIEWDEPLRDRDPAALERARHALEEETRWQRFLQFLFDRQWRALRQTCRSAGVRLLGDVPLYVAHESADVWAHREIFRLDSSGRPTATAGVPPDYFNENGQWWGNPVFRWDRLRDRSYDWWVGRLGRTLERFDAVRLDHFIGIQSYWEIPPDARTARQGRWTPGPGADFLDTVFSHLDPARFVAEDLGSITDAVRALRDRFALPGMRVLQFGFDGNPDNEHLPHRYPERCVAYTGTHDNNTARGWFEEEAGMARGAILKYLASDGSAIHRDMTRAVFASGASRAIVPAQDLLGLGATARTNRPGVLEGNWRWRLDAGAPPDEVMRWLADLTAETGRGG